MYRLRKKSDAKSNIPILPPLQTSIPPSLQSEPQQQQRLPELPSADDFRTSLILPDLTRRFSLLRNSSGEPLPVDLLRSRLAEQRARGVGNQISEEEEEMILESLGLRTKYAAPSSTTSDSTRQSVRSNNSSVTHSPSNGRSAKRYSNNLFGSGRLRDYSYARSATSSGRHASSRITSAAPSESSSHGAMQELRPTTPENDDRAAPRSAPLIPSAPFGEPSTSSAEYRLSKTLGPSGYKRASLALEQAISELEEDPEDEIVMPRSAPIPRANAEQQNTRSPDVYEAGMAISPVDQVRTEREDRRASPIPSRILPGYIPGMPRPMTPREDMDNDLLRSHSITPRAAAASADAASLGSAIPPSSAVSSSEPFGHASAPSFSRQSSRPMSPPFLQRSPITDPAQRAERGMEGHAADFDSSVVSGRRRPASPLSGPSFQPLTAAAVTTSRPTTPSNVTWTFPAAKPSPQKSASGHNRNGRWFSDADESTDTHGAFSSTTHGAYSSSNDHNRSKSTSRSLRSPALPDSPLIDRGHGSTAFFSSNYAGSPLDNRPPSTISGMDLALAPSSNTFNNNRVIRSPTPTQSPSRSPSSPTFSGIDVSPKQPSRRSSKQNSSSSPFSFSPYNPVLFSPLANSSRSSLESTGSSYHSSEAESKFLFEADAHQPAWHDVSFSSNSSSTTPGGSPDADWNAEDVIGSYAGLHKSDFSAIQEKLVGAVMSKNSVASELRERAPSLRRRRPSTSQSNYSMNYRIATPPLQPQASQASPPADGSAMLNSDQILKANALLYSVVDSINTQSGSPLDVSSLSLDPADGQQEASPTTRRNRDLAQVLFGVDKEEADGEEPSASTSRSLSPDGGSAPLDPQKLVTSPTPPTASTPSFHPSGYPESLALHSPLRSPSTPHIPQSFEQQAQLTMEVQRKAEAAMLALRKPSNSNLKEGVVSSGSNRKKISPHQISTPTLLSASTSVDTIPLRTPPPSSMSSGPPSKLGSRFKKLRGTLRKSNNLPVEEIKITPFPLDIPAAPPTTSQPPSGITPSSSVPPSSSIAPSSSQPQFAQYDSKKLHPIDSALSANELGRFQVPAVPVPSPPASAGPGLKGFMARFRGKSRASETVVDYKHLSQHPSPHLPHHSSPNLVQRSPIQSRSFLPHLTDDARSPQEPSSQFPHPPQSSSSSSPPSQHSSPPSDAVADGADSHDSQALRQLFDAASKVGLDQGQLSELLVRSGSISSKSTDWTMLTRNNSSAKRPESRDERPFDSPVPPTPRSEWVSFEDAVTKPVSRKSSLKQTPTPEPQNVGVRRPRQRGAADTNTIVRRTIIVPDRAISTADLNALVRKNSSRRRRASALSVASSNRSISERVPTPPPPRSPTNRRFSDDRSPPVPQLPQSWASRMDPGLLAPNTGGPVEKSNSAYDSLYDMYSGENKVPGPTASEAGSSAQRDDHGPALEVIELANGETIWSIVNGLRDDDVESLYTGRSSFQSDYDNDESVQVFVRDHTRAGSKGSNSSFFSRKKLPQGKNRPETKVFYSSSAQIGRLIENLSQGMDAGAFNFQQGQSAHPPHSATSSMSGQTGASDAYLTVEERLEHMLGSMRAA